MYTVAKNTYEKVFNTLSEIEKQRKENKSVGIKESTPA